MYAAEVGAARSFLFETGKDVLLQAEGETMNKWEKFLLCAMILNAGMLSRAESFQSYLFTASVVICLAMFFIFTPGGKK